MSARRGLSFLHTAEAYVAAFDRLLDAMAPAMPARNAVARRFSASR